jgi:hypothetical protein
MSTSRSRLAAGAAIVAIALGAVTIQSGDGEPGAAPAGESKSAQSAPETAVPDRARLYHRSLGPR